MSVNTPLLINTEGGRADKTRKGTSDAMTLFNIVCTMAGTGILQLPFTLKQGGWITLGVMLLCGIMTNYTGHILLRCLYLDGGPRINNYPAIGQAAFGNVGRYIVHIFHKATLIGVCTIFLILSGGFLSETLAPYTGHYTPDTKKHYMDLWTKRWIWVSAGVLLIPVVGFRTMKELAPLSFFGMMAAILVVIVVIVISFMVSHDCPEGLVPQGNSSYCWGLVPVNGTNVTVTHEVTSYTGFPSAFAAITVSFGGHSVFPTIEEHMRSRESFHRVFNYAYALIMLLYVPVATAGYYAYGDLTGSPILNNLPTTGALGAVNTATKFVITFHVLTAYPLLMNVVVLEMEGALKISDKSRFKHAVWMRSGLRLGMVLLTAVIAWGVPYFGDFMTLLGALCLAMIVFILPVVFNFRLRGELIGWPERIWGVIVVLFGGTGAGIAVYQAIVALVQDLSHHK